MSTKEANGIPSLSQDARTHYCAHAYAHTYAHAQSQACAFHEHANDSCQQNARSIGTICGAASTPIRSQEACGIPLQSGCMHALLYARTCTHICTCARLLAVTVTATATATVTVTAAVTVSVTVTVTATATYCYCYCYCWSGSGSGSGSEC